MPMLPAAAAPLQHHVRGTVTAVRGDTLTLATERGPVVVTLGGRTRYVGVVPASLNDVTVGTFIGAANVPGPGAARALEVVVFPKSLAGTGEGDYPWDLPDGARRQSSMTNGTVAAPTSMTNATVSHVGGGSTRTVKLTFKGGTKIVAIPPGVSIVRIVPANRALIVSGARVVVFPPLTPAARIIVGERGAIPPM